MRKWKRKEGRKERRQEANNQQRDTVLLLLSAAFLFGAIMGCLLEGKLPASPYIASFWSHATQGTILPPLWRELWLVFRWPIAVVVLAMLPLAGVTLPILFFLRGLFLSYGLVALIGSTSGAEILCTMVILGPTCLLTIPILFVLGTAGLLRSTESSPSSRIRRALCCVSGLVLCVFLDQAVVPQLLTVLLKGFTATSGSG